MIDRMLHRAVRVFPAEAVTRTAGDEVDPRDAGLTRADVDAIWGAVVSFYRRGLHFSLAICLRRHRRIVFTAIAERVTGKSLRTLLREPLRLCHFDTGSISG